MVVPVVLRSFDALPRLVRHGRRGPGRRHAVPDGRYAQWANWHRRERGHLFEGRYRSVLVETESHALEVYRYIALNPVRAGLVRDPTLWRWSSLPAVLGLCEPEPFLDVQAVLDEFGPSPASARRRIRTFIREGLAGDVP